MVSPHWRSPKLTRGLEQTIWGSAWAVAASSPGRDIASTAARCSCHTRNRPSIFKRSEGYLAVVSTSFDPAVMLLPTQAMDVAAEIADVVPAIRNDTVMEIVKCRTWKFIGPYGCTKIYVPRSSNQTADLRPVKFSRCLPCRREN